MRGKALRCLDRFPEGAFRRGKREAFELLGDAAGAPAQEYELPEVGYQNEAIFAEVFLHLVALRNLPCVLAWRFDFDDAARWNQPLYKRVVNR